MVQVGNFNTLKVIRKVAFGFYLDGSEDGILLPSRFAPKDLAVGNELNVFVYHDSENRLIATTQQPKALVGEIAVLTAVAATKQGAFLDWGLMKDLFVPVSKQRSIMQIGGKYLVKLYIDEMTGRITATEKIESLLSSDVDDLKEMQEVKVLIYRKTQIGYAVIIDNNFLGLLHNNQVFKPLEIGMIEQGFIKTIRPDGKIDVLLGKPGFKKTEDESEKIIRLMQEQNGFLPYSDKTDPEIIYEVFGMSKKTFKMTIGALYKQQKIQIMTNGIQLTK